MATEFIDKARISVSAGKGGNGAVAFHREKYIAAGGPDGGDGGNGGDIILQVDDNMSTLMDFRYKRKYTAENGMDGQGSRKFGKSGKPLTIRVPRGTLVRDAETNEIIQDMSSSEPYVLCRGGKGGWGNCHFATPTRQVPRFAKAGLPGESHDVILELKLLADVGLIGFPNVGKSTLLSVVSKARPKIANYHFTTLYPNLGVVYVDEGVSFVMADIPGIIEGAADGAGLGHDFLRHIDRCRLLVHVVDVSGSEGRDPVADFDAINAELAQYSPELATRPQIVVANKTDIMEDEALLEKLRLEGPVPEDWKARQALFQEMARRFCTERERVEGKALLGLLWNYSRQEGEFESRWLLGLIARDRGDENIRDLNVLGGLYRERSRDGLTEYSIFPFISRLEGPGRSRWSFCAGMFRHETDGGRSGGAVFFIPYGDL